MSPNLLAGTRLPSGCGFSTVLPDMDFETYSEAGFNWNELTKSYTAPKGATKKGIFAVGGAVYSEHHTTEVLSLAYDLKDAQGPRLWIPGMIPPRELFDHMAAGGLAEAWNCAFEYWIWKNVCTARMGWPELPFWQLRDAMAKSRAHAWPGALKNAAKVAGTVDQKMTEGTRLINKFCVPRKPTKKSNRRRIRPEEDAQDGQKLYNYCIGDIKAESGVSLLCPDLSPSETEFWLCTQAANVRGLGLDMISIHAGVAILDQALIKYNAELERLTWCEGPVTRQVRNPAYARAKKVAKLVPGAGGALPAEYIIRTTVETGGIKKASEVKKLMVWLASRGVHTQSLDADGVELLLKNPTLPPDARRALEIRQLVGSAGVKKLYAMQRMASKAGRAHDLIAYHAARTGRDGGQDIQPQNLVKNGPKLIWCGQCGEPYGARFVKCAHCGFIPGLDVKPKSWSWEAVPHAVKAIRTGSLEHVERIFGDALLTLSGCIRGMFTPAPEYDFLCSDYSSIEAVVTAVLAGEDWRVEAFNRKEDIYLRGASGVTGISYEEYKAHEVEHGERHPDRNKIGKIAELGLGFGGWIGAWRQFDSSDTFSDDEVKKIIVAWREASPKIVELWGGQVRGKPWAPESFELFGLEGMAISAVQNPGRVFAYNGIEFEVRGDALYCQLPSGRRLTYHRPRLSPSERWDNQLELSFEGWNSNPKMGPIGWIRIQTYGGRIAENVIQATARDIMAHAVPALERAGYLLVLRVHDELIAEVPAGTKSIEELETIMGTMPPWAVGWPVRAAGGWRGKRYRKD